LLSRKNSEFDTRDIKRSQGLSWGKPYSVFLVTYCEAAAELKKYVPLMSEFGEPFLGERNGVGGRGIVGGSRRGFAVKLQRLVLISQFFIGLGRQAFDERVVLVGLQKFLERRFVVSRIVIDIPFQIRKECRLLGVAAFIEDRFGGGDVLLRFLWIAAAGGDARLRVFPAEIPQVHTRWHDIRLTQSRVVPGLIPLVGRVQIAGIDANARGLV